MNEILEEFYRYLRLVRAHRWVIPICAAAACIIGWSVIALLSNKYRVRATVQVERSSMLQPLLKGITVETDIATEMAGLMRQMMLVPKNLELVVHDAGLDADANTPEALERLVSKLETEIDISAIEGKRGIYTVTYHNANPEVAQRVVDTLINRFLESVIAAIRADSEDARRILDEQIEEYRRQLEASTLKLKSFKERHVDIMSEDGRSYFSRLQDAKGAYQEALLNLHEAEQEVDAIREQPTPSEYVQSETGRPVIAADPIEADLQKAESELSDLQLKYTAQHPDVIARKRTIEQLKELKHSRRSGQDRAKAPHSEPADGTFATNPNYQTWKTFLTRAEAKVAALRSRVAEYKRRLDELQEGIATMPQLEAELNSINRELIIQEDSYQKLVARREAATISEKVEKSSDLNINMLEPPRVPTRPISPNRILLNTAVLLGGIGSGVALAILLGLINPTIYTRQDIRKLTDIPILGSISVDRSLLAPVSYRRILMALGSLLLMFIGLNAMYLMQAPILTSLAGAITR